MRRAPHARTHARDTLLALLTRCTRLTPTRSIPPLTHRHRPASPTRLSTRGRRRARTHARTRLYHSIKRAVRRPRRSARRAPLPPPAGGAHARHRACACTGARRLGVPSSSGAARSSQGRDSHSERRCGSRIRDRRNGMLASGRVLAASVQCTPPCAYGAWAVSAGRRILRALLHHWCPCRGACAYVRTSRLKYRDRRSPMTPRKFPPMTKKALEEHRAAQSPAGKLGRRWSSSGFAPSFLAMRVMMSSNRTGTYAGTHF